MKTKIPNNCTRGFNLVVVGLSFLLFLCLILYAWLDTSGFGRLLAKDNSPEGPGVFEHLTVIVLLPGIFFGLYAFWRYRDRLPHPVLGFWILAWSLACIYFAGEEASWGQWYFHWKTPDLLVELNDQGETNFHNMSSWLDQKPRALVELFIVISGFLIPIKNALYNKNNKKLPGQFNVPSGWGYWINAPAALIPASLMFIVSKISHWLSHPHPVFKQLGNGELREFLIAWFLMLYLSSYAVRLQHVKEKGINLS